MRTSINILFFFLPFLVFWLYVSWARRRGAAHPPEWPWIMLTVVGVGLVAASFIFFRLTSVDEADCGQYVPAHYEDGQLIDGHCERQTP
ncbi:MAG TPA: DUF6111 family protein [Micropepsaceae bacterium]|nr:DUF6111 family protein [Micropepsaceae bacterium]HRK71053.1 DUF6111 family protein [Micropepsaceae bacterium]